VFRTSHVIGVDEGNPALGCLEVVTGVARQPVQGMVIQSKEMPCSALTKAP